MERHDIVSKFISIATFIHDKENTYAEINGYVNISCWVFLNARKNILFCPESRPHTHPSTILSIRSFII